MAIERRLRIWVQHHVSSRGPPPRRSIPPPSLPKPPRRQVTKAAKKDFEEVWHTREGISERCLKEMGVRLRLMGDHDLESTQVTAEINKLRLAAAHARAAASAPQTMEQNRNYLLHHSLSELPPLAGSSWLHSQVGGARSTHSRINSALHRRASRRGGDGLSSRSKTCTC